MTKPKKIIYTCSHCGNVIGDSSKFDNIWFENHKGRHALLCSGCKNPFFQKFDEYLAWQLVASGYGWRLYAEVDLDQ